MVSQALHRTISSRGNLRPNPKTVQALHRARLAQFVNKPNRTCRVGCFQKKQAPVFCTGYKACPLRQSTAHQILVYIIPEFIEKCSCAGSGSSVVKEQYIAIDRHYVCPVLCKPVNLPEADISLRIHFALKPMPVFASKKNKAPFLSPAMCVHRVEKPCNTGPMSE